MNKLQAIVDFDCICDDCVAKVSFNVSDLTSRAKVIKCPYCHQQYEFEDRVFRQKVDNLFNLITAVNQAKDILDDCQVSVKTKVEEVFIPYNLLLTRLNVNITLEVGGREIAFNFRFEPLNQGGVVR